MPNASMHCPYCIPQKAAAVRYSRKPVLVDGAYQHIDSYMLGQSCHLPEYADNFQVDFYGSFRIRAPKGTYSDWTPFTLVATVEEEGKHYVGFSNYFTGAFKTETVYEINALESSVLEVLK